MQCYRKVLKMSSMKLGKNFLLREQIWVSLHIPIRVGTQDYVQQKVQDIRNSDSGRRLRALLIGRDITRRYIVN